MKAAQRELPKGQVSWDGEGDPQEASTRPAVLSWYASSLPGLGRGTQGDGNDGFHRVRGKAAAWSLRPAAQLGRLGDPSRGSDHRRCGPPRDQVEAGPALAIVVLPKEEQSSFWQRARTCNDHLDGACPAPCAASSQPVAMRHLPPATAVLVSTRGRPLVGFSGGTWGAYPGETIENVARIGVVLTSFLLKAEKTVGGRPSFCHIGTTPKPMDLEAARMLCAVLSNNVPTKQHNANNVYRTGNFLPIEGEGVWPTLVVEGTIPKELTGCFLRNGTNQRYAPQGKMHMFDGDAMLHAFVFAGGQCTSYANTYIRTPRFLANEAAGREEALTTFGDLTLHGLPVAKKFAFNALKQRAGAIPR